MLADQLGYVVGVDPHRDVHALAVVHVLSGRVLLETSVEADSAGDEAALLLADEHAPGRPAPGCPSSGVRRRRRKCR